MGMPLKKFCFSFFNVEGEKWQRLRQLKCHCHFLNGRNQMWVKRIPIVFVVIMHRLIRPFSNLQNTYTILGYKLSERDFFLKKIVIFFAEFEGL